MHIKKVNGVPFFSHQDLDEVAVEVSNDGSSLYDVKHKQAIEKFRNDFVRNIQAPIDGIQSFEENAPVLREIFEGYPTGVLKIKQQDISGDELAEMVTTLNETSTGKLYSPVTGDNREKFLIEKTLARKVDMQNILQFVEGRLRPTILKVRLGATERTWSQRRRVLRLGS